MATLIAALVGLLLGSLLSVLVGRWPQWRGVAMGRSECPDCHHPLAWFDLVPLLSWLFLKGHCRYCRGSISAFYPALELTMAAVLGVFAYTHGVPSWWSIVDYVALVALVSLFFFDLKLGVLPDVILLPLGGTVLARLAVLQPEALGQVCATGAVMAGLLGALYVVSRGRWLGLGDVKLAFVIGVLFGYPVAVGVTLAAIWAGALVGIGLILLRRANMQTALPFGSFWVAAAVAAMLWPGPIMYISALFIPIL